MTLLSSLSLKLSGRKAATGHWLTSTPYTHIAFDRQSLETQGPVSINLHHTAYAPDTTAFRSSSITSANGPLDLSLNLTNLADGFNVNKWVIFRAPADPAIGFSRSTITGTSLDDRLAINVKEIVNFGYLESLVAKGFEGGTINMGAGNDSLSITTQVDSTKFQHFLYGVRGTSIAARGTIDMGSGDDTVSLTAKANAVTWGEAIAFQGKMNLGDGNDRASFITDITGSKSGTESFGMQYSTVDAGAGDDDILIGTMRDSRINLGDGNDSLTCYGSQSQTDFLRSTIDGGAGIDQLVINTSRWDELVAAKDSRLGQLESLYGQGGAFGRQGLSAEQSYFARQFDIQNKQLGSVGNDRSDSFTWQGGTFTNIEQIAVAGAIFDTSTSSFI
jgi:hypothetical protein